MLSVEDQELYIETILGLIELIPRRLPDWDDWFSGHVLSNDSAPRLWQKELTEV